MKTGNGIAVGAGLFLVLGIAGSAGAGPVPSGTVKVSPAELELKARSHLERGTAAFQDFCFERARGEFLLALEYRPEDETARNSLKEVDGLLGRGNAEAYREERRSKILQASHAFEDALADGRRAREQKDFSGAIGSFRKAGDIAQGMAWAVALPADTVKEEIRATEDTRLKEVEERSLRAKAVAVPAADAAHLPRENVSGAHVPFATYLPRDERPVESGSYRASSGSRRAPLEAWKLEIISKLDEPVSFRFENASMDDVLTFFRETKNINFFLDPQAAAAGIPPVTFEARSIRFLDALNWIAKITNLAFTLRDGVVYFAEKDKIQVGQEVTRFYNIADLVLNIQDFAGPEISLSAAGGHGAGNAQNIFQQGAPPAGVEPRTAEDIIEMIKALIPANWD